MTEATDSVNDLEIMQPDHTITVGGRTVTVMEYRFTDGLHVRAKAKPFVRDLQAQVETGEVLAEDVLDIIAEHADLVRDLVLDATEGADEDWLYDLDDDDGQTLLLTWWAVNGPFFMRQIVRRLAERMAFKATTQGRDGSMSSTDSSAPATASPTISANASRSVN